MINEQERICQSEKWNVSELVRCRSAGDQIRENCTSQILRYQHSKIQDYLHEKKQWEKNYVLGPPRPSAPFVQFQKQFDLST